MPKYLIEASSTLEGVKGLPGTLHAGSFHLAGRDAEPLTLRIAGNVGVVWWPRAG